MKYWYKIICKMCGNTIRVEESKKVYSKEGAFLNLESGKRYVMHQQRFLILNKRKKENLNII